MTTIDSSVSIESIGLISDTHGLLRDEALRALEGCDVILHAGDVGSPSILERLSEVAPTVAVRGNVDSRNLGLPFTEWIEVRSGSCRHALYLIHILDDLDLVPDAAGINAVVYGHTHRPSIERRGGVLYVNPGSAGPKRLALPVTVARVEVGVDLDARVIELDV